MLSLYVAPWTTALLFAARLFELRLRHSIERGKIISRWSLPAMIIAGSFVVIAGFAEYVVSRPKFSLWLYCVGVTISLAGFGLRASAARALGSLWSVHIEIRQHHRIVETGPFRWIRHPIYVSLLIDVLGGVIILESWSALIVFVVVYFPIVMWRLRREERAMCENLGRDYQNYAARVPALIPNLQGSRHDNKY